MDRWLELRAINIKRLGALTPPTPRTHARTHVSSGQVRSARALSRAARVPSEAPPHTARPARTAHHRSPRSPTQQGGRGGTRARARWAVCPTAPVTSPRLPSQQVCSSAAGGSARRATTPCHTCACRRRVTNATKLAAKPVEWCVRGGRWGVGGALARASAVAVRSSPPAHALPHPPAPRFGACVVACAHTHVIKPVQPPRPACLGASNQGGQVLQGQAVPSMLPDGRQSAAVRCKVAAGGGRRRRATLRMAFWGRSGAPLGARARRRGRQSRIEQSRPNSQHRRAPTPYLARRAPDG